MRNQMIWEPQKWRDLKANKYSYSSDLCVLHPLSHRKAKTFDKLPQDDVDSSLTLPHAQSPKVHINTLI